MSLYNTVHLQYIYIYGCFLLGVLVEMGLAVYDW